MWAGVCLRRSEIQAPRRRADRYPEAASTFVRMQRFVTSTRTALLLVVTLTVVASACSADSAVEIPGSDARTLELAPDFTVPTHDGGTFSLDDHIAKDGRPIFMNLWASWCFPCRAEMPAIDAASKTHTEIAFIGISVKDTRAEATAFVEEIGVTYTIGFDDDNQVDDEYRPLGLPASYIISGDGVILERIFGEVTEESLAEKFAKHFG